MNIVKNNGVGWRIKSVGYGSYGVAFCIGWLKQDLLGGFFNRFDGGEGVIYVGI